VGERGESQKGARCTHIVITLAPGLCQQVKDAAQTETREVADPHQRLKSRKQRLYRSAAVASRVALTSRDSYSRRSRDRRDTPRYTRCIPAGGRKGLESLSPTALRYPQTLKSDHRIALFTSRLLARIWWQARVAEIPVHAGRRRVHKAPSAVCRGG